MRLFCIMFAIAQTIWTIQFAAIRFAFVSVCFYFNPLVHAWILSCFKLLSTIRLYTTKCGQWTNKFSFICILVTTVGIRMFSISVISFWWHWLCSKDFYWFRLIYIAPFCKKYALLLFLQWYFDHVMLVHVLYAHLWLAIQVLYA